MSTENSTQPYRGITAWFVVHPNAAKILLMIIILGGLSGLISLPQEVFPPFAPSRVDIQVPVFGSTAQEVEELVAKKIEDALDGLSGIERIIANATNQGAFVHIELSPGFEQQSMLNVIKSRVDGISSFPQFAEPASYSLPERSGPVKFVNISGDASVNTLLNYTTTLKDSLSLLPGVSYATIENEPETSIYIEVSPDTLQKHNLSLEDISNTVNQNSVNTAAGFVQSLAGRYQIRTNTMAGSVQEFRDIPVLSSETGATIYLSDIATVSLSPDENYVQARYNGKPSLMLSIYRDPDVSFADVNVAISEQIAKFNTQSAPFVEAVSWQDESREFSSRTSLLIKNGVTGFIIICVLMSIFVNLRIAFWTAVGIPVSIVGAAGLVYFSGLELSLNAITLLGFLIALGMIVDDALVIGESIQYQISQDGHTQEAVVKGVEKVATPATFGVLTTIAAFFPLTLTEGEMGSRLGSVGMIVICCLIVSLVESKLVLPAHLRSKKKSRLEKLSFFNRMNTWSNSKLAVFIERYYRPLLIKVIRNPVKSLAVSIFTLGISISLIPLGLVNMVIIPNIADYAISSEIQFHPSIAPSIKSALGDEAVAKLHQVGDDYKKKFELDYDPIHNVSQRYEDSILVIDVELAEVEGGPYDAYDIQESWREVFPASPSITSLSVDAGSGSGEKIAIEVSGKDLDQLRAFSNDLMGYLKSQDDVVDIRDSELSSMIEFKLVPTAFASGLGIRDEDVIRAVRSAFYGAEAQRVTVGEREVRVLVRLSGENRQSVTTLENMLIPISLNGGQEKHYIPLLNLVDIERNAVSSEVRRINKQRTITVYANTKMNTRSPEEVADQIESDVLPGLVEKYAGVTVSVEGEAKEANKSLSSMLSNTGLAIFVLFALMALPIGSFKYPALILCLIPFGLVGALWGHAISGMPFSLMSIFGVVALSGVLINNGILITDQYLSNMKEGKPFKESIELACVRRFRPIILTSITTLAGLLPLLWETDPEALWLIPIAISLGWGLLAATGITMLVFPAMIVLMDRAKMKQEENHLNERVQLGDISEAKG